MKILVTIHENDVAARFDLATEVLIAEAIEGRILGEPRIILLPRASGDELCGLSVKEDVSIVICGGVEGAHFEYLIWKKITVFDGIIGPYSEALDWVLAGRLKNGTILPGSR
ncbi:MAG: NifB/NifX family molybdenum-iron cluster-binding protein [Proteobacteria bacterium]|nr:NifB/NifX family molybdenum-iron cluster-binding protein [Pseudomonadota bacterium]MBU1710705.1 NifB/NifX family molybdenum-iron cluster-binding protein [Pseudomonadota bacterium]